MYFEKYTVVFFFNIFVREKAASYKILDLTDNHWNCPNMDHALSFFFPFVSNLATFFYIFAVYGGITLADNKEKRTTVVEG